MALDFVCVSDFRVKKEPDWDDASDTVAMGSLYAGHKVKEEMVLGPEVLQPADVAFLLKNQADTAPESPTGAEEPTTEIPRPAMRDAPVKKEVLDAVDPPMVRIPSPYGFDDVTEKIAAKPALDPNGQRTSQNLQKYRALYDIKPCFIPLVHIDSAVKYRSGSETLNKITKPKRFFCDFCSKGFSLKQSLQTHIRIHTGEKPYSCSACRKKFSDMSILIRHRRVHTGEKPHVCDECKKQFSEKYLLKYHKRLHTGETAYACRLCSKKFNHISNLKRHIRHHENKPFVCEICSLHFKEETKLEAHLLKHLKNKPFACDNCDKCFTNVGHRNRHSKIHSDKKYNCKVCNIGFTQAESLKRHASKNVCRKR